MSQDIKDWPPERICGYLYGICIRKYPKIPKKDIPEIVQQAYLELLKSNKIYKQLLAYTITKAVYKIYLKNKKYICKESLGYTNYLSTKNKVALYLIFKDLPDFCRCFLDYYEGLTTIEIGEKYKWNRSKTYKQLRKAREIVCQHLKKLHGL